MTGLENYLANHTLTSFVGHTYDANNRLILRSHDADGYYGTIADTTRTLYIQEMGQIELELEKAGSWADFEAEDLTHRYLWGPGANNLLVDEAVSELFDAEENDTLHALPDHLGSVRDLVSYDPIAEETVLRKHTSLDSFGQVVDEAYYDKSGDPIASSHAEAVDQLFMYTGAMRDEDTGLQNHWNRWYDPATGSWISVDPIKDGVNWYGYVGNRVSTSTDPTGLFDPDNVAAIVREVDPAVYFFFFGARNKTNQLLSRDATGWQWYRWNHLTEVDPCDDSMTLTLDENLTDAEAARSLINMVRSWRGFGDLFFQHEASRNHKAAADLFLRHRAARTKEAGEISTAVAEAYIGTLGIMNDGTDLVISGYEASEGNTAALWALLPLVSVGVVKLYGRSGELLAEGTPDEVASALSKLDDAATDGGFRVGKHSEMPTPRGGMESHHGVMSRWMTEHCPGYNANNAPAVLMPDTNHNATRGIYNTWRAEMRQRMGGSFDWSKVSKSDIIALSERMFDAAQVPPSVRAQYYHDFDELLRQVK